MLRALLLFASATAARALRAPAAPQAAARSLFHEELATLRAVADGASATGRFRPHARYTSRFGEALRHGAGSDPDVARRAAAARDTLDAGGDPLAAAAELGEAVLQALECEALVESRRRIKDAYLLSEDAPRDGGEELKGRLFFAALEAIADRAPCLKGGGQLVDLVFALALARGALLATDASRGRRLERAVTAHFHALPREADGVAFDGVAAADLRRTPRFDGCDAASCSTHTPLLVAFAGLGASGFVRYEWRGACHRVARRSRPFDALFVADPAGSWYTGGLARRYRSDAALATALRRARRRRPVAFVGDSMGAAAALKHARHADAVHAVAPQTASLHADVHVGREDLYLRPASCARRVERPMARSVGAALRRGAAVSLHHAAACDLDAAHADALAARVPATRRGDGDFWAGPAARGALDVVAHGGCESHDLAGHLAQTGRLDDLLARAIEDAVNSH